jgi:hypothetical protein
MALHELYSKLKEKRAKAGKPVIFIYDTIPEKFKNQVVHIWKDAIGPYGSYTPGRDVWNTIHDYMSRELGVPALGGTSNPAENCFQFLYREDVDHALDIIQTSFNAIEHHFGKYNGNPDWMQRNIGLSYPPDLAIKELNMRFLENDIGYQYENCQIIRIDSQYTHAEIILPAIQLLNEPQFKPALDEFMKAHENYRRGRFEEAISEALKAFESVMKIIIAANKWQIDSNAPASKLIQICFDNQLLPSSLLSHFTSLRTILESGLPTIRNKYSGHGDGVKTIEVPGYFALFALNLAASNILLLVHAYKEK